MTARVRRRYPSTFGGLIYIVVVLVTVVGLGLVAFGPWRRGVSLVGFALIFGVLSKFSAFWGSVMNLAFLLAGTSANNPLMVVLEVAMIFGGAGVGYYGADYYLLPMLRKLFQIGAYPAGPPAPVGRPQRRGPLPTARPVH